MPTTSKPPSDAHDHDHVVEFYSEEERLIEDVAQFTFKGLQADEAVVIIATAEHRAAFEEQLRKKGVDLELARRDGRLFMHDAAETLSQFMVNGMPDELRFIRTLEGLIAQTGGRQL